MGKKKVLTIAVIVAVLAIVAVSVYYMNLYGYVDLDAAMNRDDEYYVEDDTEEDFEPDFDTNTMNKYSGDAVIFGDFGSASLISGKTLVVSIFADDLLYSWSADDTALQKKELNYLEIACNWLEEQLAKYYCVSEFVYNWEEDEALTYHVRLNGFATEKRGIDDYVASVIEAEIDSQGLLEKYKADNIVYLFVINTDENNTSEPLTTFYQKDIYEGDYEYCVMMMNREGEEVTPALFAREILRTFGAADLSASDEFGDNFGITEKFVNYCTENKCNDIMFTTNDSVTGNPYYEKIVNEISEVDAYYLGIAPAPSEISDWGFRKCQY